MCAVPLGRRGTDRQTEVKVKVGQAVLLSSPLFQPSPFCYIGGDLLLHWKARHTHLVLSYRCPKANYRYVKGHISFF